MKLTRIVDIEDMSRMAEEDKEAFALNRRKGFGASDSSILLGVNHWTKLDDLIFQKNQDTLTPEEIAIGEKPQVRMGADLEPLILDKFCKWAGWDVQKPTAQYRLEEAPYLTVNYDGLMEKPHEVPVECKCVSTYARKYWDFSKAMTDPTQLVKNVRYDESSISALVEAQAKEIGIPPYYYTQVQQQLLGVISEHAYLVALDVKEWQIHVFKIYEDDRVQDAIISAGCAAAEKCRFIESWS